MMRAKKPVVPAVATPSRIRSVHLFSEAGEKLLVSRGEAAQLLWISQRGLDYLIANRRLPTRRIGGRVLIPVAELRKYVRGDHPESIVA